MLLKRRIKYVGANTLGRKKEHQKTSYILGRNPISLQTETVAGTRQKYLSLHSNFIKYSQYTTIKVNQL